MKTYYHIYTGGMYSQPAVFSNYEEAKAYYEDCKEWVRDEYITLTKIVEEKLESEFLEWED